MLEGAGAATDVVAKNVLYLAKEARSSLVYDIKQEVMSGWLTTTDCFIC